MIPISVFLPLGRFLGVRVCLSAWYELSMEWMLRVPNNVPGLFNGSSFEHLAEVLDVNADNLPAHVDYAPGGHVAQW